ncbi:MAG: AsmA family protein [Candidatus Omnitrophica bacterium]|nr:AsmA family protein [Candidatus Omnitrophota bacterium]MBU1996411.1 AsmA family protein [Candidatus Omnitrophota bacterium]
MFKFIRKLFLLFIIIGIFLSGKNYLAKFAIEKGVKSATGLDLQLKKCVVEIKETSFEIKGIQLENPAGFSDKYMFEAPEIFVNYTILPIFKKLIHLEEIRFDLDSLIIVKNEKGQLNLMALLPQAENKDKSKDQGSSPKSEKKVNPFDLKVDKALLKINKIVYKDYSKGGAPVIKEFNIGIYETFENVEGAEELAAMIIQKILLKTALSNLINIDISGFQDTIKNIDIKSLSNKFKVLSK